MAGLVGPGIRAAGSPEATAAFDAWARVADADGRTDLWGLQAATVRGMIVDGESFTLIEGSAEGARGAGTARWRRQDAPGEIGEDDRPPGERFSSRRRGRRR